MSEIEDIKCIFKGADTIPEILALAVDRFADKTSVKIGIDEKIDEYTFSQLKKDSDALSMRLKKLGAESEKIAVIGDVSYEWLVTYFGVIGSGNIVVPIDKNIGIAEIEKLLYMVGAAVLVFDTSCSHLAQHIEKSCISIKTFVCLQRTESFIGLFDFIGEQDGNLQSYEKVHADQTAMIVFTSGTTGESKGVMLSNQNICHNVLCSGYLLGKDCFKPEECVVPILPLHHMLQITAGILTPLLFWGMTVCIGNGLKDIPRTIARFKPALIVAVPMVAEGFYKQIMRRVQKDKKEDQMRFAIKFSNLLLKFGIDIRRIIFNKIIDSMGGKLRVLVCGGAFLDSDLVERFQEFGISLLNGYGITECSPVVSCNRVTCKKKNSVGLVAPKPYCQVKVENNEILIKGSIVMQGYYMDEESTKNAYCGSWFKTGDLGYLDDDNYLYITGRKKNLIILKDGNNISPEKIEKLIEQHPLIDSVFVYAVTKSKNEILVAAIHPDYAYAKETGIDDIEAEVEKVVAEINKSCPLYMHIETVEIHTEAFDKTALGKVRRFKYIMQEGDVI